MVKELGEAKKLGFGMMRLPTTDPANESAVDIEAVKTLVDTFLDRGFTYFDTAWMYCGERSEEVTGEALVKRHPRDSFTLTTKLPAYMIRKPEDRDYVFNEQLRRTGAGYFDYYWLHDINSLSIQTFEKMDCFSFVAEKKAQGLVRHIGFSFHDGPELLDRILTEHPEMEYVQLQLNYLDWDSISIQSRRCYEVCEKHGKPVLVMEPVKGGTLAKVPEEVEEMFRTADPSRSIPSWAIRFAASRKNVVMVLSGMSNLEQVEDNADLYVLATIESYQVSATAVTADEVAAMSRLTVTVKVKFTNEKHPEDNFEKSFAAYEDYNSENSLDSVEGTLCETIVEKIVEDIFNATVANW